ncbi:ribulose-phosphate 3-epimerase [Paraliobacillus ryukyuensis]|uniref:Ribulose-phosphate 3-epimerase n=1 Tax=Paraliobacillus ryukyuensis TaxID=200904 RepID=A0A366EDE3_9BACI|nr:ribulose-phosphate 3-epimerase [Paraliobacillus ryukyuensis]RBP00402.1 ribulose-phosphate 3-epimerase [Paraliobacillus ryukyuensis]
MIQLAPSILASDFSQLGSVVKQTAEGHADMIHIDVMDGQFVPNITWGPDIIKAIRPFASIPFDVHLMVDSPERYIDNFIEAGADIITVHIEACTHLHRTIQHIKSADVKAGVVLNPATPVEALTSILPELDMVLLMSVNPGFGGQIFIPSTIEKLKRLRNMVQQLGESVDIEVDGGVNKNNVADIVAAGANVIVAGSAIYQTDNIAESVRTFRAFMKETI